MDLQIADSPSVPIYRRIADAVCEAVTDGRIVPGARLPGQMSLARKLGVNPLTVSRGYELLESQGIVRLKRGSGTYIDDNAIFHANRQGKRALNTIVVVVGETSLGRCPRETLFIVTDIVDGLRDVLGPREAHFVFAESFDSRSIGDLGEGDAVLIFSARNTDLKLVDDLTRRGVPVLSTWEMSPTVPCVTYDRQRAASLACEHLVACGYRRIGFIGRRKYGPSPTAPKYSAYTHVMHDAGLDILARDVRDVGREPGRAYAAARDIIATGDMPQAIFVDTDYKAMEVINALNDAGLSVPRDVGIASYDDVPDAAHCTPPLTTVHVPRREIGQSAATMLQQWKPGEYKAPRLLGSELIVRQSCLACVESTP